MLILHIGLPKTATTFLQYKIFKRAEGLRVIHRTNGKKAARLCGALKSFAAAPSPKAIQHRRRIRALVANYVAAAPGPLLVTDENISVQSVAFWIGAGPEPGRLARRLGKLRHDLRQTVPAGLRVLVGIRRQDQWLASRYAESSKAFEGFEQVDFDRRMAEIAGTEELAGPLAWLDYAAVRATFAAALGPENVLLVPMERLTAAPRAMLAELGHFVGEIDLVERYAQVEAEGEGLRRNVLSAGANVWRLRKDESELRLDPGLQAAILDRFAASNRALAAMQPLEFDS